MLAAVLCSHPDARGDVVGHLIDDVYAKPVLRGDCAQAVNPSHLSDTMNDFTGRLVLTPTIAHVHVRMHPCARHSACLCSCVRVSVCLCSQTKPIMA